MNRSKKLLSMLLAFALANSTGVVFADSKQPSDVKDKEASSSKKDNSSDSFNVEDYMSAALANSQSLRSQENALKIAERNKSYAFDAMTDIPYSYSKKEPFDYLKITKLDLLEADLNVFSEEKLLDLTDSTVRLGLYEEYIGLIKALDSIEVQKKLIENKEKIILKIKGQYAIGKISKTKLESEERAIEKLKLQYDSLKLNKISSLMGLNRLIGQPILKEYSNYVRPDINKVVTDLSLEEHSNQALTNRMEIIVAEKKLELKKAQYEKVNKLLPYKKDEHNVDYKNCVDEAQTNLEKAKLDIEMEAREIIDALQSKIVGLENAEKSLKLAKSDYDIAKSKFDMGLITIEEIEEAKLSCSSMENDINGIKLDLWLYRLKMSYASGLGPGIK